MKISALFFLLVLALNAIGQSVSKETYLNKSKKQKKVGLILLAVGGASLITGVAMPKGDVEENTAFSLYGESHKNDGIKAVLVLGGLGSVLTSVPFFISSHKNKQRAATLAINRQKIILAAYDSKMMIAYQPSVTVKISF